MVSAAPSPRVHRNETPVRILGAAGGNSLRYNSRTGVHAKVNHFRSGIRLLEIVRDRNRIEFALAFGTSKNAARILPGYRRTRLDLSPHDLGAVAAAVGSFGHEIVDATLALLVTREPVSERLNT